MTQDNTPPGPIFKARLLHTKMNAGPKQGVVGEISSRRQLSKKSCRLVLKLYMKINRGGVILCHRRYFHRHLLTRRSPLHVSRTRVSCLPASVVAPWDGMVVCIGGVWYLPSPRRGTSGFCC